MALTATLNDVEFAVGDKVKLSQRIKEGDKERTQIFEGKVMAIRGRDMNKTFVLRRIGEAGVGIERIFPLASPTLEKISIVKKGGLGVNRAKLYYVRGKAPREIEKIYTRQYRRKPTKT
jgi:large subunit ribosomal protein L19